MSAAKELSGVLIISPRASGEKIAGMLDTMLFEPVRIVTNAGEGRRLLSDDSFDIVIINAPLPDDAGYELALDAAENTSAGVMLTVPHEVWDEARYRVEDAGVMTLAKPLSSSFFESALALVTATRRRLAAAEKENERLRRRVDEIRTVDRAKLTLIERGMTEPEAHRYIEKGAMDARLTRRDFAARVIAGE